MKISGSNLSPTTSQVQQGNELNLKDGQKVVGKIISIDRDEAILELAGHTIEAKIEGDPPLGGTNQTFLVSFDALGRTILKMMKNSTNSSESGKEDLLESFRMDSFKALESSNISLQEAIEAALIKDNLPVTADNVNKVARYVQEFQSKYQLPIDPKVFSFMIAQKWPVTSATILAAWLNQEPEIRDLVRKKLQNSVMKPEEKATILESLLKLPSNPAEIVQKLKLNSNLPNFDARSKNASNESSSKDAESMPLEQTLNVQIPQKFQWLLEQNIAIHKVLFKEASMGSPTHFIPLLVNDSQSNIHECFIEWKKEKGNPSQNNNNNQLVNVTIPTENLGMITMRLQIGSSGTQINLKVVTEEIRQYLNLHNEEMKSAIAIENVSIVVGLVKKEDNHSEIRGVDLWM